MAGTNDSRVQQAGSVPDGALINLRTVTRSTIANAAAPTLDVQVIHPLATNAFGSFRRVVTNECNTATSNSAALTICRADFDCDSVIDFFDYLDFAELFASSDSRADFNANGAVDLFDYLGFVEAFSVGC